MEYKTWKDIREKVEEDLDLQEEVWITPEEMIGYGNEAIDSCEAEIKGIYEDYFLAYETMSLVSGQELYDLPSTIYANKIRKLIFNNGSDVYEIKRMRQNNAFILAEIANVYRTSDYYTYFIVNLSGASKPKIKLVPVTRETGDFVKVYFIRNANKIDRTDLDAADATIVDIPEFYNYIIRYVKAECYKKEGHPNLSQALADLEMERRLMIDTLSNMVPDGDSSIELDLSFYEGSS